MKISIILPLFLAFLAVYAMKRRHQDIAQKKVTEDFFERERQANSVRKKDISHLDYLPFSLAALPIGKYTDEQLLTHEESLKQLADKKLLNLSSYSNTDLKLMYGAPNFPILSEYDDNYHTLASTLLNYATRLIEIEKKADAIAVLEYAMTLSIDSSQIYLLLANLYTENHTPEKIQNIIAIVSSMDKAFQKLVLPKLEACRIDG
ncbi:MAG: hypothetical protein J6A75_03050 [Lachnospiraceae bacterium]|nr:hypothetical protein [Lachnospiraceae bacterium]